MYTNQMLSFDINWYIERTSNKKLFFLIFCTFYVKKNRSWINKFIQREHNTHIDFFYSHLKRVCYYVLHNGVPY